MRVSVVRIVIATTTAVALAAGLSVAMIPAPASASASVPAALPASAPAVLPPAVPALMPSPAPAAKGLRKSLGCAVQGGQDSFVPAVLQVDPSIGLDLGAWFEECQVGTAFTIRNLTPVVWTLDLTASGSTVPRPSRIDGPPRFDLFHATTETLVERIVDDPTIAPGETLLVPVVSTFVLAQDLDATVSWSAMRASTKWMHDVAGIDLRKEMVLAAAQRRGTAGSALAACYGAVDTIVGQRQFVESDSVLLRDTAVVIDGMRSTECGNALVQLARRPSVVEDVRTGSPSLALSVGRSVRSTVAVSALERFLESVRSLHIPL